jgi:hypothetical protein
VFWFSDLKNGPNLLIIHLSTKSNRGSRLPIYHVKREGGWSATATAAAQERSRLETGHREGKSAKSDVVQSRQDGGFYPTRGRVAQNERDARKLEGESSVVEGTSECP